MIVLNLWFSIILENFKKTTWCLTPNVCGSQNSSITIILRCVKNASWIPSQTSKIRNAGGGAPRSVLTSSLFDSNAHSSLRTLTYPIDWISLGHGSRFWDSWFYYAMKIENHCFIYFNLMPAMLLWINSKAEKQVDWSGDGAIESVVNWK